MPSFQIPRRDFLRIGFGAVGLSLSQFFQLQSLTAKMSENRPSSIDSIRGFGKAKSCIILFAWGGMSHLETLDLKPNAPKEYRGEFNPVQTKVSGIQIGEHLPLLAQQTHRLAIVRSAHHRSSAHGKGMYWNLTGRPPLREAVAENQEATGQDWPCIGSVLSKLKKTTSGIPGAAMLPYPMWDNRTRQGGHDAGFLGRAYDPILLRPKSGLPYKGLSRDSGSADLKLPDGVDKTRYSTRQSLLRNLDHPGPGSSFRSFDYFRTLANEMILSPKISQAMDLDRENPKVRDSYGNHLCGQSVLLARRLTEVGIPLVTICCAAGDLNGSAGDHWDTHGNNFNRLKNDMLPPFDRAFSALLNDLSQRGTLSETLVVVLTDFGRTPRINGGAGRDHYPNCYSVLFAGGGIQGGQVYGKSDRLGAEPLEFPCGPADFHATIYHALGIPVETQYEDNLGRPLSITDGGRVLPLF